MTKRAFDILISLIGLAVLFPFLALLALVVLINMGTPILFRQERAGKAGKPFAILKLRTMTAARDNVGNLLPDKDRLTPWGRFLRSTSLDELPELWNVLRGEMSLVGPRPLLMEYLPLYSPEQARRHEVLPGITGWAQVHGRNDQSWEERFALDVWYVENRTFLLDLKVLWMTLGRVLKREGISARGQATMPHLGQPPSPSHAPDQKVAEPGTANRKDPCPEDGAIPGSCSGE